MSLIRELVFWIPTIQLEIRFSNIGASFLSTTSRECWPGCSESYVQLPTVPKLHLGAIHSLKPISVSPEALSEAAVVLDLGTNSEWLPSTDGGPCLRSRCLTSTRPQDSEQSTWRGVEGGS